jgi:hypothetical protein
METKLNTLRVKEAARAMLKEKGEVWSGMEIKEISYMSIRSN